MCTKKKIHNQSGHSKCIDDGNNWADDDEVRCMGVYRSKRDAHQQRHKRENAILESHELVFRYGALRCRHNMVLVLKGFQSCS